MWTICCQIISVICLHIIAVDFTCIQPAQVALVTFWGIIYRNFNKFPQHLIDRFKTHSLYTVPHHFKWYLIDLYSYDCDDIDCYICNSNWERKKRWFGDLGAVATLWSLTVAQVVTITTSTASIGMVQMLWYHPIWVLTYVSVMSVNRTESFNHWNSRMVMVTTLRLLASALFVIIEISRAAGSRGWSRYFSFIKQWQYQGKFMTQFSSMPLFRVHIYLCLQSLIPYSSPLIICYPVDANLHMYSIIAVYAPPSRVASMPVVR